MGLDMYLTGEHYLSQMNEDEQKLAKQINDILGVPKNDPFSFRKYRVKSVVVDAFYWRKSYEIHEWFMDNLDTSESCNNLYVDDETLENLLTDIQEYLDGRTGYFVGERNEETEKYFIEDLERTGKGLRQFLDTDFAKKLEFYYSFSY
jgi:hypothetical protein